MSSSRIINLGETINSGETAHIPTSGTGPISVTISIHGPGGTGYQPHGVATVEHYDPSRNAAVKDNVLIGGGFQPTTVTVKIGSPVSNQHWIGEVKVTGTDLPDGQPKFSSPIDGWGEATPKAVRFAPGVINAIDDGLSGVFGVPKYGVSVVSFRPSPQEAVNPNTCYPKGYLEGRGIKAGNLPIGYKPTFDGEGNLVGFGPTASSESAAQRPIISRNPFDTQRSPPTNNQEYDRDHQSGDGNHSSNPSHDREHDRDHQSGDGSGIGDGRAPAHGASSAEYDRDRQSHSSPGERGPGDGRGSAPASQKTASSTPPANQKDNDEHSKKEKEATDARRGNDLNGPSSSPSKSTGPSSDSSHDSEKGDATHMAQPDG